MEELPIVQGSVVYDDGNVKITEKVEPGLRSITINLGPPQGQTDSGNVEADAPLQKGILPAPQEKPEVVIPVDTALPISRAQKPIEPPPEMTEWPKNSRTDACEILDIDAAANIRIKYGENPCKPPPPTKKEQVSNKHEVTKKDQTVNKTDATKKEGFSQAGAPKKRAPAGLGNDPDRKNDDIHQLHKDGSSDDCESSQKQAKHIGRRADDSDLSNYERPGCEGTHTPRKPAYSGGDHDIGGRYLSPTPYEPRQPPARTWPEDNRRIESSGQYTYPPTPPPTPPPPRPYDPRGHPPPPRTRDTYPQPPPPPPQPLPPCPPDDEYHDAYEDFWYDAANEQDWCPPGYTPGSRPCNYSHPYFSRISKPSIWNKGDRAGERLIRLRDAGFHHHQQGASEKKKERIGQPIFILEQRGDHAVIIRKRKGNHIQGCPWQRKNHHCIQPGDVRNTSSIQGVTGDIDTDPEEEQKRSDGRSLLHVDEQGLVHLNAFWYSLKATVDEAREEVEESTRELKGWSEGTPSGSSEFHSSVACDTTLGEGYVITEDHKDVGEKTAVSLEECTVKLDLIPEEDHVLPSQSDELTSRHRIIESLKHSTDPKESNGVLGDTLGDCHQDAAGTSRFCKMETPSDGTLEASGQKNAAFATAEISQFCPLHLQRRRSNPAFPLILRLGSWVRDAILPEYPK